MKIEVSTGEAFDRISILQIKLKRLRDLKKLPAVRAELTQLYEAVEYLKVPTRLKQDLRSVNEQLWDALDDVRSKTLSVDEYISLHHVIYSLNDKRINLKQQINEVTDSQLQEVKQYGKVSPE